MFLWTKARRLESSGFLQGFTDWHCHILPAVDDGARSMDESLKMLERYEKLGVKQVWLTPHIMEDIPNTTEALRIRFNELNEKYKGVIALHLAAENMLDNLFDERLEANDLLPIGDAGNHLLVETSYYNPPMDLLGTLQSIKAKGYHPVLAHPERYRYMDKTDYRQLHQMGVKFQLNLFSLLEAYGKEVKVKAHMLLAMGMYTLMGSDVHRYHVLEAMLGRNFKLNKLIVNQLY